MKIEHRKIADKIYLLTFENQLEITSSLLRFQEHYESPYFKGKLFTLDEFKTWYIPNSPNGKRTGKFTYYLDWNGFNFPSHVMTPFFENKFSQLSENEKKILDIFKNENESFYVIGVHGALEKPEQLLRHEIAHALFSTDEDYKREVLYAISQHDVSQLREEIRQLGSYHEDVLDDEVHAYIVDSSKDLSSNISSTLSEKLKCLYEKYLKNKI